MSISRRFLTPYCRAQAVFVHSLGGYTTDEVVAEQFEELVVDVAAPLSLNLDGGIFVNQSAAFSDFHATGGNPVANASLCNQAFVTSRFVVVQSRRHDQLS